MAEPYVNPAELPVKRRENIALGVLGALLFSAAGGLVHFGLLQLGYIAWISALVGMAARLLPAMACFPAGRTPCTARSSPSYSPC